MNNNKVAISKQTTYIKNKSYKQWILIQSEQN